MEQVDEAPTLANRNNGWRYLGPRGRVTPTGDRRSSVVQGSHPRYLPHLSRTWTQVIQLLHAQRRSSLQNFILGSRRLYVEEWYHRTTPMPGG